MKDCGVSTDCNINFLMPITGTKNMLLEGNVRIIISVTKNIGEELIVYQMDTLGEGEKLSVMVPSRIE